METTSSAYDVYHGSNAVASRRFCNELEEHGPIGHIATALFHAQKSSSRAKVYKGGIEYENGRTVRFTDIAYRRKGMFLERLAALLAEDSLGMVWGWGSDDNQPEARHVLYIDLPQGQVSLHSLERFVGPDYPGAWDGTSASAYRVIQFCDWVWRGGAAATAAPASAAPIARKESSNGEGNCE